MKYPCSTEARTLIRIFNVYQENKTQSYLGAKIVRALEEKQAIGRNSKNPETGF
jgi:hypothetical protein